MVNGIRVTDVVADCYTDSWAGNSWSDWVPLDPAIGDISGFTTDAGVYRVRHQEQDGLEYIGQTGRSLRGRVRALARGTFAEEMPYRDPHTAAPCLWAVRQEYGPALEISISVPPFAEDDQSRKGFEEYLIALYRREAGESPTANFGRMIPGYQISSYRKGGFKGGPVDTAQEDSHTDSGIGPLDWDFADDPLDSQWMGIDWSDPSKLESIPMEIPDSDGVYRIWDSESPLPFEYIGESKNLRTRILRHRRNRDERLNYSYALLPDHTASHKRAEAETDLLGAHWHATNQCPRDQF